MRPASRVISIEFNELCPNLMDKFIKAGELPNFKRFHDEAAVYETDAEESGELLNPWVQWVSIHTGLSASEHQVTTLSEGHTVPVQAVWDVASTNGKRVWVCGSMNARYDRPLDGYLLPDPWSTGCRPYPQTEFDPYIGYVRSSVQEYTHGGGGGMKSFLTYMLKHGLSASTMLAAAKQIASEKLGNTYWRRAGILDLIQYDLFKHYYRKVNPHLATFFLNSTAHYQHCYWRNMEPEAFKVKPTAKEQKDYAGAILYGYQCMDKLVGRFLNLAGTDTTLFFSTALSQQPYLDHEEKDGRKYYHLHTKAVLAEKLGLKEPYTYEPVMAEQFYLRFADAAATDRAEAHLTSFVLNHRPAFKDERNRLFNATRKDNALLMQCRCTGDVPADARITSATDPSVSIPFHEVFYLMPAVKSGRHHPSGMLWIRRPDRKHHVVTEKVSLRSVAPTMLRELGLPVPAHMRAEPLEVGTPVSVAV
jgi:hypothetical protein